MRTVNMLNTNCLAALREWHHFFAFTLLCLYSLPLLCLLYARGEIAENRPYIKKKQAGITEWRTRILHRPILPFAPCFPLFLFSKSLPLFSVIKNTLSSIKYNKEKINLDHLKTESQ